MWLGNCIYKRNGCSDITSAEGIRDLDTDDSVKCSASPRCAVSAKLFGENGYTIGNAHLCGGRFDDEKVFSGDTKVVDMKAKEVESLRNKGYDIILGDFNSTLGQGQPGGVPDYKYPTYLANNKVLPKDVSTLWTKWQFEPVTSFLEKNYESVIPFTQFEQGQETTWRGNCVVDWIFVKKNRVKYSKPEIVDTYTTGSAFKNAITDHKMVLVDIEAP